MNIRDYMSKNTFLGIMAIAGILMIIGLFLPWAKAQGITVKGFEDTKAPLVFIGGWITILGAMMGFDLFNSRTLEDLKPITDTGLGIVGGIISLIGVVTFVYQKSSVFSSVWGLYVVVVGIILAFITAIMAYLLEGKRGPRRGPRRKSGGL